MKFSLSLMALVASTYAAPMPATSSIPGLDKGAAELKQLGSELSSELGKAAKPLSSALPVPDSGAGLDRRQNNGGPNFYDAGSLVQKLEHPLQLVDGVSHASKREIPLTSSVDPVLAPIESLTHSMNIAGRSDDDCEEGEEQHFPQPRPAGMPDVTPTPVGPPPTVVTPTGAAAVTPTPVSFPSNVDPAFNPQKQTPPSIQPARAPNDHGVDPANSSTSPSEPTGEEPCEEEAH